MRVLRSAVATGLPRLEPVEEIIVTTVSVFGQVVVLTQAGVAALTGGGIAVPGSTYTTAIKAGERSGSGPEVAYPLVELLPDGEILLVDARCHRRDDGTWTANAHVFDPAGVHDRSFCLGDAIEHVGVDAACTIWVGYFDEGVFNNYANDGSIGALGLVRFDRDGRLIWRYQPPPGAESIIDWYALNVDAHAVWTSYYTDFPLVRITNAQARAYTPTPVRGARAVLA
jgi:hypothetical protein